MEPFNRFLEVAAQSNGEIITFENIAKDTGVSAVTVKSYFQILVDTLIEIKSRDHIQERDLHVLNQLKPDFKKSKAVCLSQDPERKKIDNVLCLPWQEGLEEIFS